MKEFVKKNFVLILGISLPVILIIVFAAAQGLTRLVDPPEYTAVFAVQNNYGANKGFNFEVGENGKLSINFKVESPNQNRMAYNYSTQVYIFNPKTDLMERFEIRPEDDFPLDTKIPIKVPEKLAKLKLLPDVTSPDGYVVEQNTRSGGNIFTELFGFGRRNYSPYILTKNNRKVPVPTLNLYYGKLTFIGWVIEEDARE